MVQNYNNLFVIIKNAILKKQNYVFIFYSKISLNIIKSIKFLFLVKRHGAPIKQYTYLKKFALFCVFSKQSLIVFLW